MTDDQLRIDEPREELLEHGVGAAKQETEQDQHRRDRDDAESCSPPRSRCMRLSWSAKRTEQLPRAIRRPAHRMNAAAHQVTDVTVQQARPKADANGAGEGNEPRQCEQVDQEQCLGIPPDERDKQEDGGYAEHGPVGLGNMQEASVTHDHQHDEEQAEAESEVQSLGDRLLQHPPADTQGDAASKEERRNPAAHQLDTESDVRAIPLRRWTKMLSGPGMTYAGHPCQVPTSRSPVADAGTRKCSVRSYESPGPSRRIQRHRVGTISSASRIDHG